MAAADQLSRTQTFPPPLEKFRGLFQTVLMRIFHGALRYDT